MCLAHARGQIVHLGTKRTFDLFFFKKNTSTRTFFFRERNRAFTNVYIVGVVYRTLSRGTDGWSHRKKERV